MFQPPPTNNEESLNAESKSAVGSTTDSQGPVLSTQDGLENITFNEGERSIQKKNRVRFSEEDDKLLIQTWLNISKDSIVGVDQKVDSFWGRIKDDYNNYRGQLI
ncbi:glutathione S-transferase T2-like, partial [Trifolium medium]|nr:glutathione S-transferase T2-like [Trifolium medium]